MTHIKFKKLTVTKKSLKFTFTRKVVALFNQNGYLMSVHKF